MLDNEIKEQRVLGTVLPAIFLGVAAFLLNVVVSRLVATQREQIAALKALGYANRRHRRALPEAGAAPSSPSACCWACCWATCSAACSPGCTPSSSASRSFEHRMAPALAAGGRALLTVATAVLGTLNAIAATVRLAPAEAMRPPAPGHYRRTLLERLGITRHRARRCA